MSEASLATSFDVPADRRDEPGGSAHVGAEPLGPPRSLEGYAIKRSKPQPLDIGASVTVFDRAAGT